MPKNAAFHFTLAAVLTSAWTLDISPSAPVCNKEGILSDKERSEQAECHLSSRSNQFNEGQGQHCNLCSEENTEFTTNTRDEVAPTSVWCHVSGESGLRCHFHNLYYNSRHEEFVFVLSGGSLISGVDSLKMLEKLYLSSANGHNAFQIKLSVLPGKEANIARSAVKFDGKTLILGRFKPDNIHHVFHDDLLPLYFTIREFCVDMKLCKKTLNIIFTDENEHGIFWDLYHMFTKNVMKLQDLNNNKNEWYCFQESYVGLNKMSVWYQYGFGVLQGPIESNFQGTHLRQFTNFVRDKLGVEKQLRKQSGILLSRKLNRKIVNEEELFDAIQGLLSTTKDYKDITMNMLTLEEGNLKGVISEFSEAVLVVGVHGSALILGMFLPPGSVMVELWPYGIDPSAAPVFKTMCELDGFDVIYIPWTNEDRHSTVYHPNYPSYYGGLNDLPKIDQDKVIESLSADKLTGLECCDSTEWLFRIYQDTKVNVYNDADFVSVNILELIAEGLRRRKLIVSKTGYKSEHLKESKYPGKVRTLQCFMGREGTSTKLNIQWIEPWNIEYLKCKELDYEVVMQSKGKVELKKYRTRESTFLKRLSYSVEKLDVWVTCLCDDFESPASYVAEVMDPYAELMEGLGLLTEVHFHAGFCAICYKGLFNEKLMHCAQCQLVSYCSKACQKADWKEHKYICKANAVKCGKNVFSKAKGQVTDMKSWIQFRTSLKCALSVNLDRPLEQFEREIMMFPKVCEICKDSDHSKLFPCPTCRSIFYCSREHLKQDADKHIQWCSSYLLCVGVDKLIKHRGSANVNITGKIQNKFRPLPKDLTKLLNFENGFSQKKIPTDAEEIRRFMTCPNFADELTSIMFNILTSERLTDPTTLFYALEQFYIGKHREKICDIAQLNIHVVGSDGYREAMALNHWEFFHHRLPKLKKLNLSMIGPEAIPGTSETFNDQYVFRDGVVGICEECEKCDKDFKYEFFNMLYHDYVDSEHYCKPDVIISYNCGFHAFLGRNDTWPRSLKLMISDPTVPLIFTSYSKEESVKDLRVVLGKQYMSFISDSKEEKEKVLRVLQGEQYVSVTLPSQLNPFRGLRPIRDFSRDDNRDMFQNNQYITGVNGEKISN